MGNKRRRQEEIRELLARNDVRSHEQLLALLKAESIETTQATLSRDLRELGVAKSSGVYVLPDDSGPSRAGRKALQSAIKQTLISCERAGNLVVLHTEPGEATMLANRLKAAALPQAIGIIADDNTVFIATASWNFAQELNRQIRSMARRKL